MGGASASVDFAPISLWVCAWCEWVCLCVCAVQDEVCCVCDGSSVPGLAALLTPRLCSACVTIGTHRCATRSPFLCGGLGSVEFVTFACVAACVCRYRRERPGLGIGVGVSMGGVKGSALGLGSRLLDGVDGASMCVTVCPPCGYVNRVIALFVIALLAPWRCIPGLAMLPFQLSAVRVSATVCTPLPSKFPAL